MNLQVGQQAPNFELPDQNGKLNSLKDNLGKWVLLYFYPKDDTPGCTIEACNLRDNLPNFEAINAKIFGISIDTVESHKNFESKHNLNFTILADPERVATKLYEVDGQGWMGGASRTSFLISPEGKIAKIYLDVNPSVHANEVLEDIKQFNNLLI